MKRAAASALAVGILSIAATLGAYLLNIHTGGALEPRFVCVPFTDGCVSISRAARSGPGLAVFRGVMLPVAVLLVLFWRDVRHWLRSLGCGPRRDLALFILGGVGAVFLVFYVTALGGDGEAYRWMRRYGVTLFFGGTALAQLLLVWNLWPQRYRLAAGAIRGPIAVLTALVSLQWILGVASVIKRLVLSDAELIDRIENVIEWWFALLMFLAFIAVSRMMSKTQGSVQ